MNAVIIPFPPERIFRPADLVAALEKYALCVEKIESGDEIAAGMASVMIEFWADELARFGISAPTRVSVQ